MAKKPTTTEKLATIDDVLAAAERIKNAAAEFNAALEAASALNVKSDLKIEQIYEEGAPEFGHYKATRKIVGKRLLVKSIRFEIPA